jgi:colanic acid biosynthesis protein WcaH
MPVAYATGYGARRAETVAVSTGLSPRKLVRQRNIRSLILIVLNRNTFLHIVANTPLIAIDLIVADEKNRFLLGQRVNRPAQGFWFVPGGRIRKNESLDDAFERVVHTELGYPGAKRAHARLLGIYEHFYDDNFSGQTGISTHYIVLGYRLAPITGLSHTLPDAQHSSYRWMAMDDLLGHRSVHENTKQYFRHDGCDLKL